MLSTANTNDQSVTNNTDDNLSKTSATITVNTGPVRARRVGKCYTGTGSMFSGKTTWLNRSLLREADVRDNSPRHARPGNYCVLINSAIDDRETASSDSCITTHSSSLLDTPKIDKFKMKTLAEMDDNVQKYDVIGIDEGQFFPDLAEYVFKWVLKDGKTVYVASLESTFDLEPFGDVHKLYSICPPANRNNLTAFCMQCMKEDRINVEASCSYITPEARAELEGDTNIAPGGDDKYMAVCLDCYCYLMEQNNN